MGEGRQLDFIICFSLPIVTKFLKLKMTHGVGYVSHYFKSKEAEAQRIYIICQADPANKWQFYLLASEWCT